MHVVGDYFGSDQFKPVFFLAHLYSLDEILSGIPALKEILSGMALVVTMVGFTLCDIS